MSVYLQASLSALNTKMRNKTSCSDRECMLAHRRAHRALKKSERGKQKACECVSYSVWIAPNEQNFVHYMRDLHFVQNKSAENKALEIVFYFRIPSLRHPVIWDLMEQSDEQRLNWNLYWHPYFIETVVPKDDGWICFSVMNVIGREDIVLRESCYEFNPRNRETCVSCLSPKPKMRPFFLRLQHTSPVLSRERNEFLKTMELLDAELTEYEVAIASKYSSTALSSDKPEKNETRSASVLIYDKQTLDMNFNGLRQRIEATAALPVLVANKFRVTSRFIATWWKLCLLVLYTYELATPHAQRVVRGYLVRSSRFKFFKKMQKVRLEIKASIRLQQTFRQLLSSRHVAKILHSRRHNMLVKIQSLSRKYKASLVFSQRLETFRSHLKDEAMTRIQKLVRRRNLMNQNRNFIAELAKQRKKYEEQSAMQKQKNSALKIQMMYRGVAMKQLLRQKRVENQLHGQLSMHVQKSLYRGDLWSFLTDVNNDYYRYERVIDEILDREAKMANTFVSKVVALREEQYHQAWENYNRLPKNKKNFKEPRNSIRRSITPRPGSTLRDLDLRKHRKMEGLIAESNKYWKPRTEMNAVQFTDIKNALCTMSTPVVTKSRENAYDHHISDYCCSDAFIKRVREEISYGLNDTILVFFRSASLRCLLPSGTIFRISEDAYAHYLTLSADCPEKICFEKQAWDYAEPFAHQLMLRFNLVYIRQLLPQSKMASVLQSLNPLPSEKFRVTCEKILSSICDTSETKVLCGGEIAQKLRGINIKNPEMANIYRVGSLSHINSHNDSTIEEHFGNCGLWGSIIPIDDSDEALKEAKEAKCIKRILQADCVNKNWVSPYVTKTLSDAFVAHPVYDQFRKAKRMSQIRHAPYMQY